MNTSIQLTHLILASILLLITFGYSLEEFADNNSYTDASFNSWQASLQLVGDLWQNASPWRRYHRLAGGVGSLLAVAPS